ncbi:nitrate reductase delta subunit [Mumia flava]|uniref:Nitrate reductase delta subunit n=1 Tax=Mumia flava TaxID=1348852 RepID=A0A0B2BJR9_9ACTN|nr:nitrate reductase molybdenum cofactor assembly chaperone [Mumia flava]PJJ57432.1 nitrate reductase delta subunit [Mumia flava]
MSAETVVRQVASLCLAYPDDEVLALVPAMRGAVAEHDRSAAAQPLAGFLDHLAAGAPHDLRQAYVETFDLSRKHALYLSYWTDGDTRRRGEVLGRFKQRYRDAGWVVDTRGELPDYLPLVLEFAARVDPDGGRDLMQEYRAGIELLRLALRDAGSPYAGVLEAVCATLPGESPADRAAAMRIASQGPPTETVGLDPYDPRLLPVSEAGPTRTADVPAGGGR